ncbi:DUF3021 family protein [Bacillus aerolatus]|uniref:DUF3021 family protein n=1 Tax=Bacillus aerolatus TaxID=2653354 RepID=A0A6I1FBT0_9BACI|nr:DUF3021 domain-containing protein [Bacillus aerolatus]KAB7704705.1 DUF3021 family protein [Bacillus aerolatus]
MFEFLKRSSVGVSIAGILTFIALTVMMLNDVEASVSQIWLNMLGSIVIGIYFGTASMLFDIESWSLLKATSIHFVLSLFVYYPLAVYIGWIPLAAVPIILSFVTFTIIYCLFWFGTRLYLRKMERSINASIRK